MINRLKTGHYLVSDGHIYCNNKVIKIRYDLIDLKGSHILQEEDIIDIYDNILDLKAGERIK